MKAKRLRIREIYKRRYNCLIRQLWRKLEKAGEARHSRPNETAIVKITPNGNIDVATVGHAAQ